MLLVQVILREAVKQTDALYTYGVSEELAPSVKLGIYVEVPFGKGNKPMLGLVVAMADKENTLGGRLKFISRIVDENPVMTMEQIRLIKPIASKYLCKMGDVVSMMVPTAVGKHKSPTATFVCLENKELAEKMMAENAFKSIVYYHLLEYLIENGDTEKKKLLSAVQAKDNNITLLKGKGLIKTEKREYEEETAVASNNVSVDAKFLQTYDLNDSQKDAVRVINEAVNDESKAETFLLHGITGSGKTEVFLNCAGEVLASGGTVLYLVPEISLTPQTVNWITGRFGEAAAVLHSRLTDNQRYEQWNRIRNGVARIVVGPRSGIFAPVKNLKLIIIDEEHDSSYKSDSFPKYDAREIALIRASLNKAVVVLGSATPTVTDYSKALNGEYKLIKLNKRANPSAVLPKVIPVDMKEQIKNGAGDILSIPLRNAMARAFSENKQVLLFLNRRGYSRTLICNSCGSACECPACSVGMTLHNNRHSAEKMLICHYCGYTIPTSEAVCKECGEKKFTRAGIGTEQLEELLSSLYPDHRVLRMDQDTTMSSGAHEDILSKFRNKEASILIGTQMIAKGHDFPDVTVVGILGADLMINAGNYTASERAFQLITQASGRAGRAECPGEVYIQSYKPENPLLRFAALQDYEAFYNSEIIYRKATKLPPFKAIGEITLSLPEEDMLLERVAHVEQYLKDFLACQPAEYLFELNGPMPSAIYELRGKYRMTFVIKANSYAAINAVYKQVMQDFDSVYYPLSFD